MKTRSQLQTMAVAYAEICQGEDPWVALGNFMHDWFDFARDRREQLVMDPLEEPELPSTKLQRWAAFCAASVEWLCQRYHVPCPAWVHAPAFVLPHPWWYVPQKKVRAWVIHATPRALYAAQYLLRRSDVSQQI